MVHEHTNYYVYENSSEIYSKKNHGVGMFNTNTAVDVGAIAAQRKAGIACGALGRNARGTLCAVEYRAWICQRWRTQLTHASTHT